MNCEGSGGDRRNWGHPGCGRLIRRTRQNGEVTTTAPADRPRIRDLVTARKVVLSFLLALAVVLLVVSFTSSREAPTVVATGGVEGVSPQPGEFALRQDRIRADLTDGMTGVLVIDGVEIPEDQLQRTPELGLVSYAPAPGNEIEELAPGEHQATVLFWDPQIGREAGSRSYTWRFQAH